MKRWGLFLLTNLAVISVMALAMAIFGVSAKGTLNGVIVATMIGFSGSFVSLLISKRVAKWSVSGYREIKNPTDREEIWMLKTVEELSKKAGIKMPEVGIYAGAANAFATGPTKNNSLIAISNELLLRMSKDEVEAVLAHEVSHVASGDMVTMMLVQGVLNTFVVYLSRAMANVFGQQLTSRVSFAIAILILQVGFGFMASIIIAWYSRQREFAADYGAAKLCNNTANMKNALIRLGQLSAGELPQTMRAFGILNPIKSAFATHPSIEDRIRRLESCVI